LTVAQAFSAFAGWDPVAAFDAERFDPDLVNKVEPHLPLEHPVILMEYPAAAAALARRKPDNPLVAERWELYIGGLELANAFSELTDPAEQRARFATCAAERRAMGKPVYPPDEEFLSALDNGMPPSAGIALGVDRLVMLLAGAASLGEVLPFR
jgi:lysyl-tRNA synthetase class 2